MKTIRVKFKVSSDDYSNRYNAPASKTYAYNTYFDDIKVGEEVIVDSPSMGYVVVKVTKVEEEYNPAGLKFVVSRIDDSEYQQRKINEKRREQIVTALTAKAKTQNELAQFEFLAGTDTEAAALLTELKALV